jgi:hypothetical protein
LQKLKEDIRCTFGERINFLGGEKRYEGILLGVLVIMAGAIQPILLGGNKVRDLYNRTPNVILTLGYMAHKGQGHLLAFAIWSVANTPCDVSQGRHFDAITQKPLTQYT